MARTPKRPRRDCSDPSASEPVHLIVRRGAHDRYESLKAQTKDLPVVVSWDRRRVDGGRGTVQAEDAKGMPERRREPPFTWKVADFTVGGETPPAARPPNNTTAKPGKAEPKRRPR